MDNQQPAVVNESGGSPVTGLTATGVLIKAAEVSRSTFAENEFTPPPAEEITGKLPGDVIPVSAGSNTISNPGIITPGFLDVVPDADSLNKSFPPTTNGVYTPTRPLSNTSTMTTRPPVTMSPPNIQPTAGPSLPNSPQGY